MIYNYNVRLNQSDNIERMIIIKKHIKILAMLSVVMGLSGCNLKMSPEELIQPPKLFEEDEKINTIIEESIPENAKLENISSEEGLSAVKKIDLNSDGIEEVLVFCSVEEDDSLHMIAFEENESSYDKSMEIEIPGRFFEEFIVEDINSDGLKEMIINTTDERSPSGQYMMNIYTYASEQNKLFEIDYTRFVVYDLNQDGNKDLILMNQEERTISIDYYRYNSSSSQMEFINETLIDRRSVSDMRAIVTESDRPKILIEFSGTSTDESNTLLLSLGPDENLYSEEE